MILCTVNRSCVQVIVLFERQHEFCKRAWNQNNFLLSKSVFISECRSKLQLAKPQSANQIQVWLIGSSVVQWLPFPPQAEDTVSHSAWFLSRLSWHRDALYGCRDPVVQPSSTLGENGKFHLGWSGLNIKIIVWSPVWSPIWSDFRDESIQWQRSLSWSVIWPA